MLILVYIILIIFPTQVPCRPVFSASFARKYLSRYGWLDSGIKSPDSAPFREAIKGFQNFAGLPKTGELDEETIQLMNTPRCGVRDRKMINSTDTTRRKRFVLQGSRWKIRELTYRILSYPNDLDQDSVENEIEKAFNIWTSETNISFHKHNGTGKLHIEILFDAGDHGDAEEFDGPGGTYAHAFFPLFGGGVHFDLAERWSINSSDGINLFQVAAHELGHSLGLSHSKRKNSVMSPFYYGFLPNFKLHSDDVSAIQTLYGRRLNGSRKTKLKFRNQSTVRPTESSAKIETKRNERISNFKRTKTEYVLIPLPTSVTWPQNPNTHHIKFFV